MKHLLKTIRLFPIAVMMVILAMAGAFDLGQALPINIESVFPPPNSHTASVNTDIIIGIVGVVDPDSINSATIPVQGTFSGRISGSFTTGDDVVFDPKNSFFSGELVKTTLTEAIYIDGTPLDSPFVWQFRTEVLAGSGQFIFSQNLGDEDSMGAALGDLDGDGDLDAIVSNGTSLYRYDPTPTTIWFNQGDGTFVDSGQRIDDPDGEDIALGDLDGDGDLDVVVGRFRGGAEIWFNLTISGATP